MDDPNQRKRKLPHGAREAGSRSKDRRSKSGGRKASSALSRGGRSRVGSTAASLSGRATGFFDHAAHIVCAISENVAKETCVASIDASAPVHLQVTKQGNGQRYAETLAYLQILGPHEILINEGRSQSALVQKIVQLYETNPRLSKSNPNDQVQANDGTESSTVIKFLSRACFDQNKGSELLSRVARADTYDPMILREFILLSSAHAVLHYTQQNLGAAFARNSLHLEVNAGGTNTMTIDRSTLLQLELLQNAKSGKATHSLIATIDYTKTSVGNRLLRSNLMSPPARLDTIRSRLDLVDAFLASEDFFYTIMDHLKGLPCLNKMLADVALVRKTRSQKKEGKVAHVGGWKLPERLPKKAFQRSWE